MTASLTNQEIKDILDAFDDRRQIQVKFGRKGEWINYNVQNRYELLEAISRMWDVRVRPSESERTATKIQVKFVNDKSNWSQVLTTAGQYLYDGETLRIPEINTLKVEEYGILHLEIKVNK